MKNRFTLLFLLFFVVFYQFALSQSPNWFNTKDEIIAIHPRVGFQYDLYFTDFNGFLGTVDCGLFKKGFGWGIPIGIGFEKYITDKSFASLFFDYHINKGYLVQEITFPMRDLNNGKVITVNTENQLNVAINYLEISPNYGMNFISRNNILTRLSGSIKLSLPITNTFEQTEKIISPEGAVFINSGDIRTKIRPLADGKIQTMNQPLITPELGIEALTKDFGTYKFSLGYQVNDYTSDSKWNSLQFKFEAGYRFAIHKPEEKPKPEPVITPSVEPVPIPSPLPPDPVLSIKNIDIQGQIEIGNELLSSLPIVNSVFFSNNSVSIPSNYKFTGKLGNYFSGDAVLAHNYLLTRIAEIIKKNPSSSIVLQSSTSNEPNEQKLPELSSGRANSLKQSLINVGIPENKIKLEVLTYPKNPSNQDFPEGIEENQRVDIIVKNAPLQEYVDLQKYANFKGVAKVELMALDLGGKSVEISNNHSNSKLVISKSGTYEIPLDYRLDDNFKPDELVLKYNLNGKNQSIEKIINYENYSKKQVDLNLENFVAILRFDYNSAIISEANKQLLQQLAQKLPNGSTIQILGSTDELGTAQRNAVLAEERAQNTMNYINSISKNKFTIEVGTSQDKFNESTPQGRFLNRSIRIRVKQ